MIRQLTLKTPHGLLHGRLERPEFPDGLVLVAGVHASPAELDLASHLVARGHAVLTMELLAASEIHFADALQNVPRLGQRLLDILSMIRQDGDMQDLPLGLFAAGDLTPAAIRAAAQRDTQVRALVCHGGLIDRAGLQALELLVAPLLMLFDAGEATGPLAYQRAEPHLRTLHRMQVLADGESLVPHAVAWLSCHLAPNA